MNRWELIGNICVSAKVKLFISTTLEQIHSPFLWRINLCRSENQLVEDVGTNRRHWREERRVSEQRQITLCRIKANMINILLSFRVEEYGRVHKTNPSVLYRIRWNRIPRIWINVSPSFLLVSVFAKSARHRSQSLFISRDSVRLLNKYILWPVSTFHSIVSFLKRIPGKIGTFFRNMLGIWDEMFKI